MFCKRLLRQHNTENENQDGGKRKGIGDEGKRLKDSSSYCHKLLLFLFQMASNFRMLMFDGKLLFLRGLGSEIYQIDKCHF